MNVLILSSSREEIDDYYKSIARSVSSFLANNDCNLVFGGCSSSMMGICYEEFVKKNREIYSFTTPNYVDDLKYLIENGYYISFAGRITYKTAKKNLCSYSIQKKTFRHISVPEGP